MIFEKNFKYGIRNPLLARDSGFSMLGIELHLRNI